MREDLEWWEKPVRMMRLDYLDALQRMANMDLEELARWKKEEWNINCEWVIGTPGIAPGLGYLTTFNTPKFEKYPALGDFDLIREYLPHARKHGIRVLAYLDMHWYSYEFGEKHPDWEQRVEDGRSYGRVHPLYGSGTTMCVNSRWREWAFGLIEETMKTGIDGVFLDGPVVFPECCYCASCRQEFDSKYNAEIPKWEDWANPLWKEFIDFRESSMIEFLRDAQRTVKEVNPNGVIFLNAGAWWPGGWRVARNIERLSRYQNFNGAEAFFHPGPHAPPLFFWAIEAKHLVAEGKPAVVFSHHALGSWHYVPLPHFEAEISVAQTIACGANPWFAVFDYALDHSRDEALRPMKDILGFMAKNEEYFTRTKSESETALLVSSQTSTFYISGFRELYVDPGTGVESDLRIDEGSGERKIDLRVRKKICDELYSNCLLGCFSILTRNHIMFDVILDKHLKKESLAKYSTLVLPNAACLSDDQMDSINDFVEAGGSVVSSFETGCYDELGNPRDRNPLWHIFGVERLDGMMCPKVGEEYIRVRNIGEKIVSLPDGKLIARPPYSLSVTAKRNASIPCTYMNPIGAYYTAPKGESNYAAIISNRRGLGGSIFFSCLIGDFYARYRIHEISRIFADCVKSVSRNPPRIEIQAPETVQVELRSQDNPKRFLVHLVNNTGDMERPFSSIVPIQRIKAKVNGCVPREALRLSDGRKLPLSKSDNGVEFNVDDLKVYEVVVLEL